MPVTDRIGAAAHTPRAHQTAPNPAKADPVRDVANADAAVEGAAVGEEAEAAEMVPALEGVPRRDQTATHRVQPPDLTVRPWTEGRRKARCASRNPEAARVALARSAAAASVALVGGRVGGLVGGRVGARAQAPPAIPPVVAAHDRPGSGSKNSRNPDPSGRPMNTPHDAR